MSLDINYTKNKEMGREAAINKRAKRLLKTFDEFLIETRTELRNSPGRTGFFEKRSRQIKDFLQKINSRVQVLNSLTEAEEDREGEDSHPEASDSDEDTWPGKSSDMVIDSLRSIKKNVRRGRIKATRVKVSGAANVAKMSEVNKIFSTLQNTVDGLLDDIDADDVSRTSRTPPRLNRHLDNDNKDSSLQQQTQDKSSARGQPSKHRKPRGSFITSSVKGRSARQRIKEASTARSAKNTPMIQTPGSNSSQMECSRRLADLRITNSGDTPQASPMVQGTPQATAMDATPSPNSDRSDSLEGHEPYCPLTALSTKYKEDAEQFMFMISVQAPNHGSLYAHQLLLPPRSCNDKRPTLVLDLDETLVHSFLDPTQYEEYDYCFQVDADEVIDVYCKIRPHLDQFLRELSETYELVVFTASQENYAGQVIDRIDPNGYIEHRLFRHHCTSCQGNYVKDLALLGRDLDQVVILDNSPLAFSFQPMNGIPCHSWTHEKDDVELLQLIPRLRDLAKHTNFRQSICETYAIGRLLNWLRAYVAQAQANMQKTRY